MRARVESRTASVIDANGELHVAASGGTATEVAELNGRLKGALSLGSALNPFVTQRLMAMSDPKMVRYLDKQWMLDLEDNEIVPVD